MSADNLAAHYLGGFKALSSAFRKCRHCLSTEDDMGTKFTAESFTARTQEAHKHYVAALNGPNPGHIATTYGVVRDSILNSSAYFHVVDGLVPDVMHDMLEGVLQYEIKLLLRHMILEEKLCTLAQINSRLASFDYGYQMSKDKPSPITDSRIHSSDSNLLGQSGVDTLPLII